MRDRRRVKIVATLGPSSKNREMILSLVKAGVNVFRLNMSHGDHEFISQIHSHIRSVEEELGFPIGILGDLQGPKLRCGTFENGSATINKGDEFRFDLTDTPGNQHRVQLPHEEIFKALRPDDTLLVNDGLLRLRVKDNGPDFANCIVEVGGEISNRKGVNVPSVVLPLSSLPDKDRADLEFLCNLGIDWLALSFVQRAADVTEAKDLIQGRAKIVSKIEKPAAVEAFDEILEHTDGVMVARGDLGVEMPVEQVPGIQKRLIRKCRAVGKPVIVATQMLESMVHAPVPTRAEVSDVATAIFEGTDAIMLSAESAAGEFPTQAVSTMVSVAREVEEDFNYRNILETSRGDGAGSFRSPMTIAAREIASQGEIEAICCFTQSGHTALSQARERPIVPIFALTPDYKTARFLTLSWGVNCRVIEQVDRFKGAVTAAVGLVNDAFGDFFSNSDKKIAVTAGVPIHKSGTTNILRLASLDGSDLHSFD